MSETPYEVVEQRLLEAFEERKKNNPSEKQRNNASLPAGSPMFFYCKHCGCETDVLPESYIGRPKVRCDACADLIQRGLITA
jgi:hypothetical protein